MSKMAASLALSVSVTRSVAPLYVMPVLGLSTASRMMAAPASAARLATARRSAGATLVVEAETSMEERRRVDERDDDVKATPRKVDFWAALNMIECDDEVIEVIE